MNHRKMLIVSGIVFAIIATLHFIRFAFGWQFSIEGLAVPTWVSAIAAVLFGLLSALSFKASD